MAKQKDTRPNRIKKRDEYIKQHKENRTTALPPAQPNRLRKVEEASKGPAPKPAPEGKSKGKG